MQCNQLQNVKLNKIENLFGFDYTKHAAQEKIIYCSKVFRQLAEVHSWSLRMLNLLNEEKILFNSFKSKK